jgi:hypothetical protein
MPLFTLDKGWRGADTGGMGLADRDYMKAESWQRDQRQRLAAWQWRTWRGQSARRTSRALAYAVVIPALAVAAGGGYAYGAKIGPFALDLGPALIWGGQEFESRAQFEAWLAERGVSYGTWAAKHPTAAARLEAARQP